MLSVVFDRISQTSHFDDKRVRRDAEDVYQKVFDNCILIAGRAFDQGMWRRSAANAVSTTTTTTTITTPGNSSGSSGLVGTGDVAAGAAGAEAGGLSLDDKSIIQDGSSSVPGAGTTASSQSASGTGGLSTAVDGVAGAVGQRAKSEEQLILDTLSYLSELIPTIRRYLQDQDRIISLLSNLSYYVINPTFKTKPSNSTFHAGVLDVLCAMSKLPFVYKKAWRKEVWEVFSDAKFFVNQGSTRVLLAKWKIVVQSLMVQDGISGGGGSGGSGSGSGGGPDRLGELVSRISAVPTTSLFLTRDQEIALRAQSVRKLTFALYAGAVDQYLPHLPGIQEKLVEILRGPSGAMHIEVYLCLRVLVCRISMVHLANLWPILLTEMIRLFTIFLKSNDSEKQDLAVFLAACKLLDLLMVLSVEEFQWHQWIFITETLEALNDIANPKSGQIPYALVDGLATLWSEQPQQRQLELGITTTTTTITTTSTTTTTTTTSSSLSSSSVSSTRSSPLLWKSLHIANGDVTSTGGGGGVSRAQTTTDEGGGAALPT
ncbi:hypothetical protein HK102_008700, partial [Quaeritorhiza haematococci]